MVSEDDGYDTDTENDGATHGKSFFGKAMSFGSKGMKAATQNKVARMAQDKLKQVDVAKMKENAVHFVKSGVEGGQKITRNLLVRAMEQCRSQIEGFMLDQVEQNIRRVMRMTQPLIKEAIKEPEMFNWVQRLIDDFMDEIWPEIEDEVIYVLRFSYDEPKEFIPPEQSRNCCLRTLRCMRAWYVYTKYPVDLNIWIQLRTFSWWFLLLVTAFPFFAVQFLMFFLDLLLRDRWDEYQLVQFIVDFKKL